MKPLSTTLQIKNAKKGVYSVKGASGFGFKKESGAPGAGSYTVRYRLGDRRPTMGLGAFSEISLADARGAAEAAVRLARKGVDPIEARKREKGCEPRRQATGHLQAEGRGGSRRLHADAEAQIRRWELV
jgi:hypothetical protein